MSSRVARSGTPALESHAPQRHQGGLAALGCHDADLHVRPHEVGHQITHARVLAQQRLGLGQVPGAVDLVELHGVLWRDRREAFEQRAADPGPDLRLVAFLAEHGAEGMVVGGDDEADGVGQRAVEVEQDNRPAL